MFFRVRVRDRIVPGKTPGEIRKPDCDERDDYQQHNPPFPTLAFCVLIWSVGHRVSVGLLVHRTSRRILRAFVNEWAASPFARERGRVRDISCKLRRVRSRLLAERFQVPGKLDDSKTVAV